MNEILKELTSKDVDSFGGKQETQLKTIRAAKELVRVGMLAVRAGKVNPENRQEAMFVDNERHLYFTVFDKQVREHDGRVDSIGDPRQGLFIFIELDTLEGDTADTRRIHLPRDPHLVDEHTVHELFKFDPESLKALAKSLDVSEHKEFVRQAATI